MLYGLSNLLNEINTASDPPMQERILADLVKAVRRTPSPRVKRFADVLALLATDAVRIDA